MNLINHVEQFMADLIGQHIGVYGNGRLIRKDGIN